MRRARTRGHTAPEPSRQSLHDRAFKTEPSTDSLQESSLDEPPPGIWLVRRAREERGRPALSRARELENRRKEVARRNHFNHKSKGRARRKADPPAGSWRNVRA